MAIYAYTGLPGSGKSYSVVANQILPALKAGRRVVTNIPLHEDRIRADVATGTIVELPIDAVAAQPELIDDYVTPGTVLVLDEVWRLFPAGLKVDKVPQQFKRLLAEHRHMVDEGNRSVSIVLVCQDLGQIAMFARQLVEQTFHHTKLGHLGAAGSYKCNIYHGCVTGANPPETNKLRGVIGSYSPAVYKYYKSHTMSASDKEGSDERSMDTRGNVWKRPVVWVAGVFIIAGGIYAWHGISSFFGGGNKLEPARASVATARPAPALARPAAARGFVPPRRTFRVSVIIASTDATASYALLVDDHGEQVWIPAEKCERDRLQWRCKHDGNWWPLVAPWKPPVDDTRPLTTWFPESPPESQKEPS